MADYQPTTSGLAQQVATLSAQKLGGHTLKLSILAVALALMVVCLLFYIYQLTTTPCEKSAFSSSAHPVNTQWPTSNHMGGNNPAWVHGSEHNLVPEKAESYITHEDVDAMNELKVSRGYLKDFQDGSPSPGLGSWCSASVTPEAQAQLAFLHSTNDVKL